ncbi:hypothetical protein COD05_23545 [Bacillus cereus]|nr:hypothetical protein COK28_22970 [Bacillus cereus]PGP36593.1 hypothetical protein CN989_11815 [Bacillus cereus]PGT03262.1 hypothetical protein COD05_23545 [Bacillus cereus]RFB72368.1 hypothetical protein DZB94_16155 [Bacillus sp. AW]
MNFWGENDKASIGKVNSWGKSHEKSSELIQITEGLENLKILVKYQLLFKLKSIDCILIGIK